ncbi:hypothetical protein SAMN05444392_11157 [Seinonella peptonophila]|uniref:Uncharacterized protein n=1 Tax=Seinonella peptonophila TaxID=112248 RepID=A0A1M4ZYW7_9BACL|nr:hypothetical protein SAMN05444392_11157 [Seinonella peptonophila]
MSEKNKMWLIGDENPWEEILGEPPKQDYICIKVTII